MRPPAAARRRAHPGKAVRTRAIRRTIPATATGASPSSAWDINVDTFRGHVTLHGTVPNHAAIDRAVKLARAQKGVESVVTYLEVVPPR